MKLTNKTGKIVTVCGIKLLPGETQRMDDSLMNDAVQFLVDTNRLAIVAEKATKTKAPKTKTTEPEKTSTENTEAGDGGENKE